MVVFITSENTERNHFEGNHSRCAFLCTPRVISLKIGVRLFAVGYLFPAGDSEKFKRGCLKDTKIDRKQNFFTFLQFFLNLTVWSTGTPQLQKVYLYPSDMSVTKYEFIKRNRQQSCLHETFKKRLKNLVNKVQFLLTKQTTST